MHKPVGFAAIAAILVAATLQAATYVVPEDRALVRRSQVIVIGAALTSYTQLNSAGGVETVTPISIEEVITGPKHLPEVLNVVEPGGRYGDQATIIAGSPRFEEGERVLLMLRRTGPERWSVAELVLGKFSFAADVVGQELLVRDEAEITGWDKNLHEYHERRRAADRFLEFVRKESRGIEATADYFVKTEPLVSKPSHVSAKSISTNATFSATSYSLNISAGKGSRWAVFPSAVNIFAGASGEPGAPGNGVTAVTTAIASWDNDTGSNVNYVYAGTDSTHTTGLDGPDGANTVLFERDLSAYGISPFTCSGNSYSGTLGIGGVTTASGSNTVNGETFLSSSEVDVEMNRGVANCTALFNNGDWNSAVTHEVGHTLGFRHSDQDRNSSGACSSDPSLECSSSAIMKATIPSGFNGALQGWDMNAVRAIYPPAAPPPPPPCTAPAITGQPTSRTITAGASTTLAVTATGTAPLSYTWYLGATGNTSTAVGSGSSLTVSPTTTTNYWVRVSNSCGTADSVTATVTVNPPPVTPERVRGDYNGDGKTDPAIFRPSTGTWIVNTGQTTVWGAAGDIPTPSDYDGDGKTDFAVFRPSNGTWYIVQSSNGASRVVQWGTNGDKPAPADYDGDNKSDIAVFRPSTGIWLIIQSTNGATRTVQWGGSGGDIPAPADFDGDHKDDIAIFSQVNGRWFIILSSNGATRIVQWGGSGGDVPVPTDFDGDGKADIAIESRVDGKWYIILSSNGATRINTWGGSGGDQPQPGDYDGDHKADLVVFNPGNHTWYIVNSSNGGTVLITLGQQGDIGVSR